MLIPSLQSKKENWLTMMSYDTLYKWKGRDQGGIQISSLIDI